MCLGPVTGNLIPRDAIHAGIYAVHIEAYGEKQNRTSYEKIFLLAAQPGRHALKRSLFTCKRCVSQVYCGLSPASLHRNEGPAIVGYFGLPWRPVLLRVVKNDAQGVPLAASNAADTVAHGLPGMFPSRHRWADGARRRSPHRPAVETRLPRVTAFAAAVPSVRTRRR